LFSALKHTVSSTQNGLESPLLCKKFQGECVWGGWVVESTDDSGAVPPNRDFTIRLMIKYA